MMESIVRVVSVVWTVGFLVTACCSLSVPPNDLGIFVGLFCIALIPTILGPRRHRIFGVTAMSLSLLSAGLEIFCGMSLHKRIDAQRAEIAARAKSTNSPAIDQKK